MLSDFDFWLVLGGQGAMRINGDEYPLKTGIGFLLQPGDIVEGRQNPENTLTVLACHLEPVSPLEGVRLSRGVLHFETDETDLFRQRAEEAIRLAHEKAPASGLAKVLMAEIVLRGLLACAGHVSGPVSNELSRLALEIRARPGEAWPVEEMARRCFLSVPQFNRNFRKAFRHSPRHFVIVQRVRRAMELLRETQLPIGQIAESLGYGDPFFFHRQFKTITGITPLESRRGVPCRANII